MESDGYYFFWKHRLSQWHMVDFVVEDIKYNCCEQFMMAQKALLFNDKETHRKIMASGSPFEHQKLGRSISNFDQRVWDKYKYNIVKYGNVARFIQSSECQDLLLGTGHKILVEASPHDIIWGVGLSKDNPEILNKYNWRGQNLLGYILTEVRDFIRSIND